MQTVASENTHLNDMQIIHGLTQYCSADQTRSDNWGTVNQRCLTMATTSYKQILFPHFIPSSIFITLT